MKNIIHKIASILLAFVVLISTMSFTVNMHYCGDELVETAIFHKAEGCGMEMENPSLEDCAIAKKNCCNDEQLKIEGQDEIQLKIDKISLEKEVFLVSFIYTYSNLFEDLNNSVATYEAYKPPLVTKLIFKLDETYLI